MFNSFKPNKKISSEAKVDIKVVVDELVDSEFKKKALQLSNELCKRGLNSSSCAAQAYAALVKDRTVRLAKDYIRYEIYELDVVKNKDVVEKFIGDEFNIQERAMKYDIDSLGSLEKEFHASLYSLKRDAFLEIYFYFFEFDRTKQRKTSLTT